MKRDLPSSGLLFKWLGLARLKPVARSSSLVSHVDLRVPGIMTNICCLP